MSLFEVSGLVCCFLSFVLLLVVSVSCIFHEYFVCLFQGAFNIYALFTHQRRKKKKAKHKVGFQCKPIQVPKSGFYVGYEMKFNLFYQHSHFS